ncbi:MAG: enolase C-terminal domain-like protein [Bacteroidota bacterium]
MNITKIHYHHLRIPLRLTFAQANQNTKLSDSVIVRLETDGGVLGYGEACPRAYVSGEDAASVRQTMDKWKPSLFGASFASLNDIREWVLLQVDQGIGLAAVCAIELALLDAWSKTHQIDLQDALAQQRSLTVLDYSGIIPYGKWEKLSAIVKHFTFKSWKLKAYDELALNEQRIKDVKNLMGEEVSIRMDANAGWSLTNARQQINAAMALGVNSFEQAFDKLEDAITLRKEFGDCIQLMADESLVTYADAEKLIESDACNHFSLKLSKNGGIFNSLRIYDLAQKAGIPCQLSAHFGETSILTAAGALFASLVPTLSALEGALGTYLLKEDICKTPMMIEVNGQFGQSELNYSGWPIQVDEMHLNRYSVRTEYWKK